VRITRHKIFFVDDQRDTHAGCSRSQNMAKPWMTTNGVGEGRFALIALIR
jgi:hypothetical protein